MFVSPTFIHIWMFPGHVRSHILFEDCLGLIRTKFANYWVFHINIRRERKKISTLEMRQSARFRFELDLEKKISE